ncbi:MAG: hypothetical protein ACI956_001208 [Nonlabens sp.]|jgi:hypothetical protein
MHTRMVFHIELEENNRLLSHYELESRMLQHMILLNRLLNIPCKGFMKSTEVFMDGKTAFNFGASRLKPIVLFGAN